MNTSRNKNLALGIDLGGTKLAIGIVDSKARLLSKKKIKLNFYSQDIISVLANEISLLCEIHKNKICGIGIASAGPLNTEQKKLIYPTNFPGWKIVPIVALIDKKLRAKKIRLPIAFQNDAMGAALGEGWAGAAKNLENYAVITVGTGIGTGVIFRGQPTQYAGVGGEWGHQIISMQEISSAEMPHECSVEGFASGTGILKRARKLGFTGHTVEELVAQMEAGESRYQPLFNDMAHALAILCYNLSMGLHLEKIIFTGGLMEVKHLFFPQTKAIYKKYINLRPGFSAQIGISKLGNNAGIIGAAHMVFTQF